MHGVLRSLCFCRTCSGWRHLWAALPLVHRVTGLTYTSSTWTWVPFRVSLESIDGRLVVDVRVAFALRLTVYLEYVQLSMKQTNSSWTCFVIGHKNEWIWYDVDTRFCRDTCVCAVGCYMNGYQWMRRQCGGGLTGSTSSGAVPKSHVACVWITSPKDVCHLSGHMLYLFRHIEVDMSKSDFWVVRFSGRCWVETKTT